MIDTIDQAIDVIAQYYLEKGYSKDKRYNFGFAVKQIKQYSKYGTTDSVVSNEWLASKRNELNYTTFKILRHSVHLIRSVLINGKVVTESFVYETSVPYLKLNPLFRNSLDEFLMKYTINHRLNNSSLDALRSRCSYLLLILQYKNILSPTEITYKSLKELYFDKDLNGHKSSKTNSIYLSYFSQYIEYIDLKYNNNDTLRLILSFYYTNSLIWIDELDKEEEVFFQKFDYNTKNDLDFIQLKDLFDSKIKESNYSLTMKHTFLANILKFKLFINANHLNYSLDLLYLWKNTYLLQLEEGSRYMLKKTVFLFEQLIITGNIDFSLINTTLKSKYQPPQWSKILLDAYITERNEDEMQPSTLMMDHSSIGRFLEYLEIKNIKNCSKITPQVIINFQIQDKHTTDEGKNAYGIRLRAFLRFLGRKGFVPETIELAVSMIYAKSVKIVEVLDEKQKASIYDFIQNCSNPMEYRIAAMTMLALHLGLRNCDIINLKFSEVDWKDQSISFVQQKTNIPVKLPMPNIVGNCLYLYITKGRPQQSEDNTYIFITHRMPYQKLRGKVLSSQLNPILEKYNCNHISGTHELRRDFATSELRENIDYQTISSTLGQVSANSVKPYLALDEERMKDCVISLKDIEIKGGLYD
jgi:site-specific recombinase XerD